MSKELDEIAEEIWDNLSEYIDDDISSLQMVAGTTMMSRSAFVRAIADIKAAILEHAVPAKKSTSDYDYLFPEGATRNKGFNQAVTEITEKLK